MAIADQGIMALPGQQAPEIGLEDSYDAMMQGLQAARPDAAADLQVALSSIRPMLAELTDQQLDELIAALQDLYENPEGYAKAVADLIEMGAVEEGDLPAEYDPEFLSSLIAVLLDEKRSRGAAGQSMAPEMPMPQGFARGGIAEAARLVASQGRAGDSMLAHITPREARLLRAQGGAATINPVTGLPEYFLGKIFKAIGSAFKGIVNGVKSILKSPVGRILGTIALGAVLGPAGLGIASSTFAPVLASAGVTALSGGSLKDVLISGATAYLGGASSPIAGYVSKVTGITNPLATQAITSGLVGTGAALVSGKNLKDAVQTGLTGALINTGTTLVQNALTKPITPAPIEERGRIATEGIAPGSQAIPRVSDIMQERPGLAPTPAAAPAPVQQGIAALPSSTVSPVTPPAPGQMPSSTAGVPGVMDSIGTMGQGVKQMFGGEFSKGYETLSKGAGDLFMPSAPSAPSPEAVIQTPAYKSLVQQGISADKALDIVSKNMTPAAPGMLRTYGPMAAAGLGITALAGGFEQTPIAESEYAKRMRAPIDLSGNPSAYYIQGLPGVQYSTQGAITGSQPSWSPSITMADIRVPGVNYGMRPQPRYMNQGGIAALAGGGYPRRVGQISGPGTETSDSIPAMLSDGEFVMTARAVRGMGNGSRREGAKKMYALMHKLERNASRG